MGTSKQLFTLNSPHGPGGVFFAWQRAGGGYLATTGYDQVIYFLTGKCATVLNEKILFLRL